MPVDASEGSLEVGGHTYKIHRIDRVPGLDPDRLPYVLKILLENLLRLRAAGLAGDEAVSALAGWDGRPPEAEISFAPARVLMQDFTGVPAVVDLAAMRDAVADLGGDASAINPLVPVDLVIDHSVIVDEFGTPSAFRRNAELELQRNRERYELLMWASRAFSSLSVVPPDTGICHQVNLEHLAQVVFRDGKGNACFDTLVGTDSHTTMVNGLGVLGWGVGGIEAEAAMLGQPIPMLVPPVVGFELTGELPEGATATDLVLRVAELLRHHGVVGKLVEFHGPGVSTLPVEHRATIGNMSPEYGSTAAYFPPDHDTLRYLRMTGRPPELVALVEAYSKEQGTFHEPGTGSRAIYSESLSLDLSRIEPSIAGPRRPQDRIALGAVRESLQRSLEEYQDAGAPGRDPSSRLAQPVDVTIGDDRARLGHGQVVIAAITSCTNTSNPEVMIAAGLLARKARARGLRAKPWVKTSLAPGSQVVTAYLDKAGLTAPLEELGFYLVGYGCTTCIGNSGPLIDEVSRAVDGADLAVAAVLSGNRNFEGRIHPKVKLNYLASPPLVVAYALAGTMDIDLTSDPIGEDSGGQPVYLRDIWPSTSEITSTLSDVLEPRMFTRAYGDGAGSAAWLELAAILGDASEKRFSWNPSSTYVRKAPYFDGITLAPPPPQVVRGARVLAMLGNSITTDHISPAGSIPPSGPAGRYLMDHGVAEADFNSFGARRGNHEVMVRGTFANVRLRNLLAPGTEGGYTRHLPSGEVMSLYDAAMLYAGEGVPLVVLAGSEYGSGSSRDWAAKGPLLLGVRAVIAESFERIHRSNLVGMGILPLELDAGVSLQSLGLTGAEVFDIEGIPALAEGLPPPGTITVTADGKPVPVRLRVDTPMEAAYYHHGGVLPYVLRQILRSEQS